MEISAEKVLAELARIGFSDLRDFADWKGGTVTLKSSDDLGESSRVISEVSQGKDGVKIKLWDKLNALEKIAKHIKLYDDEPEKKPEEKTTNLTININGIDVEIQ